MDAVVFAKGVAFGTVGALLAVLYLYRFQDYSRAVFAIDAGLLLVLLCGSRASFRLFDEFVERRRTVGERCVVYGTGAASLATIREALGQRPLRILGFVDEDPRQKGHSVGGYAVLGDFTTLLELMQNHALDSIVLNTRLIDVDRLRALEAACQEHQITLLHLHIGVQPFTAAS
jgi:UDP-GlcNAc:undecaprenyl-phosphate GlcNAc-1-phosphate transferase